MIGRFRKRQQLSPGLYRGQPQEYSRMRKTTLQRVVIAAALVFLVVMVTKRLNIGSAPPAINTEGKVAQETIVAEFGFDSEDIDKTRDAREAAAAKVPDSFHVDAATVKQHLDKFDDFTDRVMALKPKVEKAATAALSSNQGDTTSASATAKAVKDLAESAAAADSSFQGIKPETLAVWLTPQAIRPATETGPDGPAESTEGAAPASVELEHAATLARAARTGLEYVLSFGVLKPGERGSDFSKDPERRIVITRDVPAAGQYGEDEIPLTQALTLERAQEELKSRIAKATQDAAIEGVLPVDRVRLQDAAFEVARQYLVDTLHFDSDRTNVMREAARRDAEPIVREIETQEEIQRKGQRWSPQSRVDARTYMEIKARSDRQTAGITGAILAHALLVGIALFAFVRALP